MMIVSGRIYVRPERREAFLAASIESVAQARRAAGCLDFVVAADPLEPDRVNVYERWDSEAALTAFRGDGPGPDVTSEILRADVQRYHVSSSAIAARPGQ
jgi:heme-degrading monooxygenase HmoA